jgi:hypothetical protein
VLDPANYGSLTITHGVSIEGHGWASIAPIANQAAITINAGPSDKINIIGVVLDGTAIPGTTGIAFDSGGSLTIQDSVIRNFGSSGIALGPTTSATIAVSHTLVTDNGGHGIYLQPSGTSSVHPSVHAVFNRVEAYHNVQKGIGIFGNVGEPALDAVIVDCVAAYNEVGFYALGDSQILSNISIRVNRSTTYRNGAGGFGPGLRAEGAAGIFVSQTDMSEQNPWSEDSTSCIFTYGDNYTGGVGPVCSLLPGFPQKY